MRILADENIPVVDAFFAEVDVWNRAGQRVRSASGSGCGRVATPSATMAKPGRKAHASASHGSSAAASSMEGRGMENDDERLELYHSY